ncbi:MAG: hypothetical protein Q7R46_00720 [bacterium]|nr:hypothetical protein [bacterium]
MILKVASKGVIGFFALLVFYFSVLTLVSGWSFTRIQFFQNWYWIIGLSFGFGVQIGLFYYLRDLHSRMSGKAVAISGTASGMAMIACCSHYLVNIIPIIGISGLAVIISQYQTEFFIIGAVSNIAGIAYLIGKLK